MKTKTLKRRKLNGCARMNRMDRAFDRLVGPWAQLGVRII